MTGIRLLLIVTLAVAGYLFLTFSANAQSLSRSQLIKKCYDGSQGAACNALGVNYIDRGQSFKRAMKAFESSCKYGDAYGCLNAGFRVHGSTLPNGPKQNEVLAIKYYKKSCDLKLADGCGMLSEMLFYRKFNKKLNDKIKGINGNRAVTYKYIYELAKKSCNRKSAFGCATLARMYDPYSPSARIEKRYVTPDRNKYEQYRKYNKAGIFNDPFYSPLIRTYRFHYGSDPKYDAYGNAKGSRSRRSTEVNRRWLCQEVCIVGGRETNSKVNVTAASLSEALHEAAKICGSIKGGSNMFLGSGAVCEPIY